MLSRRRPAVLVLLLAVASCSGGTDPVPGPDPSDVPTAGAFGSSIDERLTLRLDDARDGGSVTFDVPATGRLVLRAACTGAAFLDVRVEVDGESITDTRSCDRDPDEPPGLQAHDLADEVRQDAVGTISVTAYGSERVLPAGDDGDDDDVDRFERAGDDARWALTLSVAD